MQRFEKLSYSDENQIDLICSVTFLSWNFSASRHLHEMLVMKK